MFEKDCRGCADADARVIRSGFVGNDYRTHMTHMRRMTHWRQWHRKYHRAGGFAKWDIRGGNYVWPTTKRAAETSPPPCVNSSDTSYFNTCLFLSPSVQRKGNIYIYIHTVVAQSNPPSSFEQARTVSQNPSVGSITTSACRHAYRAHDESSYHPLDEVRSMAIHRSPAGDSTARSQRRS